MIKKLLLVRIVGFLCMLALVACGGGGGGNSGAVNQSPAADAGVDQTVQEGDRVTLNGTGSSDPEGQSLNYVWTQVSGTSSILSGDTTVQSQFTAPDVQTNETLVFQLVVDDGTNNSSSDTVEITVIKIDPLTVSSITPRNNTINVDRESEITIVFSEKIDPTSIQNNFTIKDQFDNTVEIGEMNVIENSVIVKPAIKLFQNTAYTITASEQIKSVDGVNLSEYFVSIFSTKSAEWDTPTPYFESSGYSRAAINNLGGMITTTWSYNYTTGKYEIRMFEKNEDTWTSGDLVSNAIQVYAPNIAMDNNGNSIITWQKIFQDEIVVIEFRNGSWGTPWIINSSDVANSIAMSDSGYAVITWVDDTDIYVAEYINDQWEISSLITQSKPNSPHVKLNNSGDGVITWKHGDFADNDAVIYASTYNQGVWELPQVISNTADIVQFYDVALDENGEVIIVWVADTGAGDMAYKSEYRSSSWQGFEQLNPATARSTSPQVAMSNSGSAIIAWRQRDTINEVAFKEFKNNIWGDISILGPGYTPKVVVDDNGGGVVAWESNAGTHRELLMAQSFGGEWASPALFSISDNTLNTMKYDMKINDSGDVVLVWSQSDSGIWYQYRSVFE